MSLCPSKILLSTVLVLCSTHMKSNFIADSVSDFLCHLFPFPGSFWQTGTDSLCESSSDDFQKTGTMMTTLEHVFLFTFVANSFKSIILCQHTTFLISFYQTQNFQMFKLFSECLLYKFESTMEVAVGGPFQGFDDIRKLSLKSAIRRLL